MTLKVLTITAALGLAAASATAQTNGWLGSTAYSGDEYRAPYSDARRAGYDNGYRDGLKRGEQAARDGRPFDVERERDYRGADNGYNRSYGDRTRYRDDYRGGFAQGYREGYERRGFDQRGAYGNNYPRDERGGVYGTYPGNGGYGNRGYGNGGYGNDRGYGNNRGYGTASYGAYQNGVADGYRKGLEDVQNRRYPDVTRQKWYRSGDHDYDRAYGSKDAYKVDYRRGFEEGYNRAYREGRRY